MRRAWRWGPSGGDPAPRAARGGVQAQAASGGAAPARRARSGAGARPAGAPAPGRRRRPRLPAGSTPAGRCPIQAAGRPGARWAGCEPMPSRSWAWRVRRSRMRAMRFSRSRIAPSSNSASARSEIGLRLARGPGRARRGARRASCAPGAAGRARPGGPGRRRRAPAGAPPGCGEVVHQGPGLGPLQVLQGQRRAVEAQGEVDRVVVDGQLVGEEVGAQLAGLAALHLLQALHRALEGDQGGRRNRLWPGPPGPGRGAPRGPASPRPAPGSWPGRRWPGAPPGRSRPARWRPGPGSGRPGPGGRPGPARRRRRGPPWPPRSAAARVPGGEVQRRPLQGDGPHLAGQPGAERGRCLAPGGAGPVAASPAWAWASAQTNRGPGRFGGVPQRWQRSAVSSASCRASRWRLRLR